MCPTPWAPAYLPNPLGMLVWPISVATVVGRIRRLKPEILGPATVILALSEHESLETLVPPPGFHFFVFPSWSNRLVRSIFLNPLIAEAGKPATRGRSKNAVARQTGRAAPQAGETRRGRGNATMARDTYLRGALLKTTPHPDPLFRARDFFCTRRLSDLGDRGGACYFSLSGAVNLKAVLTLHYLTCSSFRFFGGPRSVSPSAVVLAALMSCSALSACSTPSTKGASAPIHESTAPKSDPDQPAVSEDEPRDTADETSPEPLTPPTVALRYDRGNTPWLGVELRATGAEEPGVEIVRVLPGSPASAARLQAGDILMRLGEFTATSPTDVSEWVRAQKPGTSQPISVLREGKSHLVRAELDGMPEFEDRLRLAFVGKPAPEINGVVTFQGEAASLRELRGRVVVLEFWASFCGVCRFLAPVLDGWQRVYQPQGAEVVGITPDDPQRGLEVARQTGMSYTLASDPDAEVTRDYLASQIPTILILDRQSIVHDVIVGYSKARLKEAETLIEKLLAEPQ